MSDRVATNRKSQVVQDLDIRWKKVVHTKKLAIRGGKKVARRGQRWSQTGTAVSDGHPDERWVRFSEEK